MRAREFITEQRDLSPEQEAPMRHTYVIPGLSASDPYNNYRFGVAIARARSDYASELNPQNDGIDPYMPEWSTETAFGEHGVIAGMNAGIRPIIDAALKMTGTPGGKRLITSPESEEPAGTNKSSPIKGFKGYPR
jgi:hypothetical protein